MLGERTTPLAEPCGKLEPRTSCGGFLSYSRAKSKFLAQQSLWHFVSSHQNTYFWTNTFTENLDHDEAVARYKPLFDWLRRKEVDYLFFWELTKKGRWHLHWVCDRFIDVNWFRAWMVERGWGQQMMVERVWNGVEVRFEKDRGWACSDGHTQKLLKYLTKYMTKSFGFSKGNVKVWGGPSRCRMGTINFKWAPWVDVRSYLFFYGKELFSRLYGSLPRWRDFDLVIRLGYEATGWQEVDPWFLDTS